MGLSDRKSKKNSGELSIKKMSINFNQTLIAKKGFTLIELLVVTAIIGVLAIISATVFNSILRSQNKTTIVNEIRQNGNLVIDKFERDIRGASRITCVTDPITLDPCPSTEGTIINVIPSAGAPFLWYCNGEDLQRAGANLLNRNERGGVKLVSFSCSFNVTTSNPQLVYFEFTLEQRNTTDKSEFKSEGDFRTTISTRNYQ